MNVIQLTQVVSRILLGSDHSGGLCNVLLMGLFRTQSCGIEADMLGFALRGCSLLETLDVRNCSKVLSVDPSESLKVIQGAFKRLFSPQIREAIQS